MSIYLNENSPITWWLMLPLSTFMLVIFLIMIPDRIHMHEIVNSGKLSNVEVIRINELTIGNRHTVSLHFRYMGGEEQFININRAFFDKVKNKAKVQLQHLPEYPNLFLAPNYDDRGELISHVILTCFFSFMVPFSIYKIRTLGR